MQFSPDLPDRPVSNRVMRELCPSVEIIAAHLEGRLAAPESDVFLDHAAECDDCRREAALILLHGPASPMPAALREQIKGAIAAALERGSTCRVTPACPDVQTIASHLDGMLDDVESGRLLDHAAACDECRRELAIGHARMTAQPEAVPAPLQMRVKHAVNGTFERTGSRRIFRPARRSYAPLAAAAACLIAVALAAAVVIRVRSVEPEPIVKTPKREVPKVVLPEPEPAPLPIPGPVEPRIEWPPVVPDEPEITQLPPEPLKPDQKPEPKPDQPKPGPIVDQPKPGPTKTIAMKFAPVLLTDVGGDVFLKRKDKKEKVNGAIQVSDGDELSAEKLTAFFLLGDFAIALMPKTTVMIAFEKETNAPAISLLQGEALIDSSAGTGSKWLLSNGSVALIVNKTRAKFSASTDEKTLAVTALQGSLSGQDVSGRAFAIRTGERLSATAAEMGTKPDPAAKKRLDVMVAARPAERTLFLFDRNAQPLEGLLDKEKTPKGENTFLRSVPDKKDKNLQVIKLAPKGLLYQPDLVFRLRLFTTLQVVTIGVEVDDRVGLAFDVKIRKDQRGQWITVDVPFEDLLCVQGGGTITSKRDAITLLTATGNKRDVFGDDRPVIRIDDVQVVERNP